MSATTHHHHDTIEANMRYPQFDPCKIVDLQQAATDIVQQIRQLQEAQLDTYTRYMYGLDTNKPACDYNDEINRLKDHLDLIIVEYHDRRRI